MSRFLIYYLSFSLLIIMASVLIGLCLPVPDIGREPVQFGSQLFWTILGHNSRNLWTYMVGFVVSPLMQIGDLGLVIIQVTIAIRQLGGYEVAKGLLPHALIELPTCLFYQGVSQYLAYQLLIKRSWSRVWQHKKCYLLAYGLAFIGLVTAAYLEGFK